MTILVDASALVSMATKEDDARTLAAVLADHADRLVCPVGEWEAMLAIARRRMIETREAEAELQALLNDLDIRSVPIGVRERDAAMDAHRRYGRGTGHPAKLNMGDCFAYACAKTNGARLLYKGDDFSHTDLAA